MKMTREVKGEKIDIFISFETTESEEGKSISIMFNSTDKTWLNPEPVSEDSQNLLNRYLDDLIRFIYDDEKLNHFKNGQAFGLKFNQEYIDRASEYTKTL